MMNAPQSIACWIKIVAFSLVAVLVGLVFVMVAAEGDVPSDAEVRLERTGCFGKCPSYRVTLRPDGSVSFEGRAFVARFGNATKRVDPSSARALFERLGPDGLWDWKDEYRVPVTDHRTTTITVRWGGRTKQIVEYAACLDGLAPKALCSLQAEIDAVAGTAEWTVCKGSGGAPAECAAEPVRERLPTLPPPPP